VHVNIVYSIFTYLLTYLLTYLRINVCRQPTFECRSCLDRPVRVWPCIFILVYHPGSSQASDRRFIHRARRRPLRSFTGLPYRLSAYRDVDIRLTRTTYPSTGSKQLYISSKFFFSPYGIWPSYRPIQVFFRRSV